MEVAEKPPIPKLPLKKRIKNFDEVNLNIT